MRWNDYEPKDEQARFERKVVMAAIAAFLLILLVSSAECQTLPGTVATTAEKVGATATATATATALSVPDSLALRSVQLKISSAESQLYQLILQVQRLEAEVRKQKAEMDQLVDGIRKAYACPASTCGFEDGENGIIAIDRNFKPDRSDRADRSDRPAPTPTQSPTPTEKR